MSYDQYDLFGSVDEYMTRQTFGRPKSSHFYPSEASVKLVDQHGDLITEGGCLRKSYFRLSDDYQPTAHSPHTKYIFMQGNMIEDKLVQIWKEMGIWHDNSVKFYDVENNISGELDAVLKEPPSGKLYGVEVKTFYGYHGGKEIFGNKSQKGFPKMSQLLQTLVYLNYWQDKGLDYFRMVYFARDDARRKTFKIELHKEGNIVFPMVDGEVIRSFTIDDVLARYKDLKHYVETDTVPPTDFELQYPDVKIEDFYKKGKVAKTKYEAWKKGRLKKHEHIGDWQCSYCEFKSICWE